MNTINQKNKGLYMIEGLTFTVIMFGVIIIIFICSGITFYLQYRKMSKKEKN